jgi:DNA-binding transcriptional LysR family regulator
MRVFDAAARHLSFTLAARELGVSQAAVSTQIRNLEDRLGVKLFLRKTRAVALTEPGDRLHRATRDVFYRLSAAIDEVDRSGPRPVTIAVTPSFAARWLFPRVARYQQQHPDHDLHLVPSIELHDFADDQIDLAIRWGQGRWPRLESEFLLQAPLTPICSPRLLETSPGLRQPEDLYSHRLLHERDHQDWRWWMESCGLDARRAETGLVLGDPSLLDNAVIAGQGVAVGRPALLQHFFDQGLMVRPFDHFLPTPSAYYLVHRKGAMDTPRLRAFREFLVAEIASGAAPTSQNPTR